jgi:transcriptional regulator GlxA family with amidase domain
MRVSVLVLDGVFDSGLSVILDTLAMASELAGAARKSSRFELTACGVRRSATTAQGLRMELARAGQGPRPDIVVVPALGCKTPETIGEALERADVREASEQLRAWAKAGTCVAGACTATFVLASSGILDEGRATTTWWLSPLFRESFPHVTLDESRMIVESGKVVTAGAALAHVDLALWIVRRRSPSLAETTARYLVFDARPSQGAYVMPDHLAHADPIVERFEQWARRHLARFSLEEAAKGVGTSERTLERRVRTVLGKTPVSFVQDLRVEVAVHRLRTTRETIDEIAEAVGYGDAVTLRTLLRKKTGRGIRELRGAAG